MPSRGEVHAITRVPGRAESAYLRCLLPWPTCHTPMTTSAASDSRHAGERPQLQNGKRRITMDKPPWCMSAHQRIATRRPLSLKVSVATPACSRLSRLRSRDVLNQPRVCVARDDTALAHAPLALPSSTSGLACTLSLAPFCSYIPRQISATSSQQNVCIPRP
mmetsp:Transcript_3645/g.7885  ORF Transcript_3645/g.7885 Transcript_3645/m.7885 type:complete len:163 (-) Transcript_3645:300-788(-)